MAKKQRTYQENFIAGIKLLMAEEQLKDIKEAADFLNIKYMTLYKIMDGTNKPTVDQGILLCNKAGYSANWLFLNKGEILMDTEKTLNDLFKDIRDLKSKLGVKEKAKSKS
jgi:selenophosphate synthase